MYEDFEGADYGGWTATGTAFGSGPGARHAARPADRLRLQRAADSSTASIDFDGSQGTLTSPEFTLTRDYVNFLVGGGAHAHDPAAGDGTPPPGDVLGDFEAPTYGAWTATGDFAGTAPHVGGDGRVGERIVDTFFGAQRDSDENRGTIESPEFTIDHDYLELRGRGRRAALHAGPARRRWERRTHRLRTRDRHAQLGRPGTSPTYAASRPGS